jgi:glycosyltransferase involved in cell wall biosynthesis
MHIEAVVGSPRVSVILCAFNNEATIAQSVDGILGQSYTDFELIVIDDASTDRTPEVLAGYADPRLIRVRNASNLGPYRSANKGLKLARGEYIARHDADDVSLPDRFRLQVARMDESPELALLGTSYRVIGRTGQILETSLLPTQDRELRERQSRGNVFLHGTVMMRRSAIERAGGYREYFPVSQDYDLFLRLSELGEIANLAEPLYLFRFHSESITRNRRELQLACRQLAMRLAEQRRAGEAEGPIPSDVLEAYPPEPHRLFLDARHSVFLYFASRQPELAGASLRRAVQNAEDRPAEAVEGWEGWALSRSLAYAHEHMDASLGAAFLRWLGPNLGSRGVTIDSSRLLGEYFADLAFFADQNGSPGALSLGLRAFWHDRRWMFNRGLWRSAWRSFGRRAAAGGANWVSRYG